MLTIAPEALFKHSKFSNYSFKKLTITISNAFNAQLFIKNLLFKMFKKCLKTLINISYNFILNCVNATCHTPIFDPNCRWHVLVGPTFVRGLIWQSLTVSTKFRQRGILKYLMFDSESGPLLSLSFVYYFKSIFI